MPTIDFYLKDKIDEKFSTYLPLGGGVMTGDLTFNNSKKITDYLPLSGGTMTGAITLREGDSAINLNKDNSYIGIEGATNNGKGASLVLFGEGKDGWNGRWRLMSKDHAGSGGASRSSELIGYPDGTVTLNGNKIGFNDNDNDWVTLKGDPSSMDNKIIIRKNNGWVNLIIDGYPTTAGQRIVDFSGTKYMPPNGIRILFVGNYEGVNEGGEINIYGGLYCYKTGTCQANFTYWVG